MFTTAMVTKWLTMMMVVISEAAPMVLLGVQRQAVWAFQSHTQHITESYSIIQSHTQTQHHTESHTNTASYKVTLSISQSHTASYRVTHRIFQRWTHHHNPDSHIYTLPELNTATPSFNTGSHTHHLQESHIVSGWDNLSISESPKLMMTWFHDKLVGYRKLDPNVCFRVSPEDQMLFTEICLKWKQLNWGLKRHSKIQLMKYVLTTLFCRELTSRRCQVSGQGTAAMRSEPEGDVRIVNMPLQK